MTDELVRKLTDALDDYLDKHFIEFLTASVAAEVAAEVVREHIEGLEREVERRVGEVGHWKELLTRRTETLKSRAETAEAHVTRLQELVDYSDALCEDCNRDLFEDDPKQPYLHNWWECGSCLNRKYFERQAEITRLRTALTEIDADKLDLLASWFDVRDGTLFGPGVNSDDVQTDLRRWADGVRAALEASDG